MQILEYLNYFPATIELSIVSMIFAVIVGVVLGVFSAIYRNKSVDHFSRVFSILGVSMPVFWLGLLLLFYYFTINSTGFRVEEDTIFLSFLLILPDFYY